LEIFYIHKMDKSLKKLLVQYAGEMAKGGDAARADIADAENFKQDVEETIVVCHNIICVYNFDSFQRGTVGLEEYVQMTALD
jgi:hypothetical protein